MGSLWAITGPGSLLQFLNTPVQFLSDKWMISFYFCGGRKCTGFGDTATGKIHLALHLSQLSFSESLKHANTHPYHNGISLLSLLSKSDPSFLPTLSTQRVKIKENSELCLFHVSQHTCTNGDQWKMEQHLAPFLTDHPLMISRLNNSWKIERSFRVGVGRELNQYSIHSVDFLKRSLNQTWPWNGCIMGYDTWYLDFMICKLHVRNPFKCLSTLFHCNSCYVRCSVYQGAFLHILSNRSNRSLGLKDILSCSDKTEAKMYVLQCKKQCTRKEWNPLFICGCILVFCSLAVKKKSWLFSIILERVWDS